jgi:hypothetical protein
MLGNFDDWHKEKLIGAAMALAGAACLVLVFAGHVKFGMLFSKIGTLLVVYGGMKFFRGPNARNDGASAMPRASARLIPLLMNGTSSSPAQPAKPLVTFWLYCGRLGAVVLVFSFVSLALTMALFSSQSTVVLTGVPKLASGYALATAAIFSLLVGISWSTLIGGANRAAIVARGALFGVLVSLPMLMVPLLITSDQLAQAATFSGNTFVSSQIYRIESAHASRGKGGMSYYASIDPYHCVSCVSPDVPINEDAFQQINASKTSIPFGADFPGWPGRRTTTLCLRAEVEHAGMAERILLLSGTVKGSDLYPCPPGAPS